MLPPECKVVTTVVQFRISLTLRKRTTATVIVKLQVTGTVCKILPHTVKSCHLVVRFYIAVLIC